MDRKDRRMRVREEGRANFNSMAIETINIS